MAPNSASHETYTREHEVKVGSERSFGLVFAAVFTLVGLFPLAGGHEARWWSLAVAAVFLVAALTVPRLLAPLNRLWFRFGLLLHKVVNPLVMGLLFFGTILPTGLILRALGKDPLRRSFDPGAKTYWIPREPPGPAPDSLKNQF